MKTIGFLIVNYSHGGGTERVTSVIANGLDKKGYKVYIISCQGNGKGHFPTGCEINCLSLHGEKYKNSLIRRKKSFDHLKRIVQEKQIDVMIAVDVALYLYMYPLQKRKLCKCIAWEHFNYYIVPNKIVGFARKKAAEKADCVVVLGKNDLKNYQCHYKHINRIEYIYNPIATDLSHSLDISQKQVIAIGRLEYQKGFDELIKIWNLVESKFPDWHLAIYGEGSLHQQLQNSIDQFKLKHIKLQGYTNDVSKELEKSSIFVLSSRFEGFVLVLLEAQSKKLPCISFDCKEGPAEIIDDNVNGFLIPPGDIEKFANKLSILMKSEELRKSFSEKSQKDLYRFNRDNIINKWVNLIESL
jgi:glycosyltransferase involved in cell wall biosynthesis